MKKILVTGGAGFIGSHTVVELISNGYQPVIIDNFNNSDRKALVGIEKISKQKTIFYEGNYQDRALLEKIVDENILEGVIHFAAYKAVGESVEKPLKYYDNNVAGFVQLLEFLQDNSISNVVFSSSCTVYGESKKVPFTEKTEIQPAMSPYGATKQMCEVILSDSAKSGQGMSGIALRYFNPIGAHESALIGELPIGRPTILVPFITQTVAGWWPELTVFGDDYPTPDGTCIRDYVHVVDLARAHVKAINHLFKQKSNYFDVFNIGTGKGSSVLEVISTFEKSTGEKVTYRIGPRRSGDIIINYADATKAKKILGWEADKTLADALVDAWRWQKTLQRKA